MNNLCCGLLLETVSQGTNFAGTDDIFIIISRDFECYNIILRKFCSKEILQFGNLLAWSRKWIPVKSANSNQTP